MENQKKISLFDLVFMSIGGIIGAGIFSMVGTGIATTGRSVALALIVGMIFTMSQQIRYIFTASMFQLSGGMYSQNALVLSPFLAGVSAVVTLVSSVSYSVFGISMAQYLGDLFPVLEPYQVPVACLVLIFFFIIASTGAQIFARAINALGILKFIALGLFIIFGFTKVQTGGFEGEPYFINGGVSFLTAVALMSFTCNGATNIINVQAIAENPKKNIPKAFFIASILVAGVYFLLGYVASGVAPYDQVAGQNLGYIAGLVLPGPLAVFFIVGGAMCSLSTALLGGISGMPFMIIGIAEDGWLPKFFTKKFNVVVTLAIISILPIIGGFSLDNIVSMMLVPGMAIGAITNFQAMSMPERFPEEWANSGLKCSPTLYRILMVISIITSLMTSFFSLTSLTLPLAIGTVIATILIFVWTWYRMKKGYVNITSTTDMSEEPVQAK